MVSLPVVGAIFDQLGERLFDNPESAICASDSKPKHLAETHFHLCEKHHRLIHKTHHVDSYTLLFSSSCLLWLCCVRSYVEKSLCAPDLACVLRWVTSHPTQAQEAAQRFYRDFIFKLTLLLLLRLVSTDPWVQLMFKASFIPLLKNRWSIALVHWSGAVGRPVFKIVDYLQFRHSLAKI